MFCPHLSSQCRSEESQLLSFYSGKSDLPLLKLQSWTIIPQLLSVLCEPVIPQILTFPSVSCVLALLSPCYRSAVLQPLTLHSRTCLDNFCSTHTATSVSVMCTYCAITTEPAWEYVCQDTGECISHYWILAVNYTWENYWAWTLQDTFHHNLFQL